MASGEGARVGGWQAGVVGVLLDRYVGQQAADEVVFLRAELLEEGVLLTGTPEVHLGLEKHALVYDDVGFQAVLGDVDREVAPGVSCPDDQDAVALEIRDVAV